MVNKIAYLVQGLPGCGKTTFAQRRAKEEGGYCLSVDRFFYEFVEPDKPDVYSYVKKRERSMIRWYWLELKRLAESETSPIYLDQNNAYTSHIWRTAGFLIERYDYDVQLVHPDSPQWQTVSELLKDKEANHKELEKWANKLAGLNQQGVLPERIIQMMDQYREYTIDDLMEQF